MAEELVGVWIVGAIGAVATTVVVGAKAVASGLAPGIGLLTESDPFRALDLAPLDRIVFGGHDIRDGSFEASAREICARNGSIRSAWIDALQGELAKATGNIRRGLSHGSGRAIQALATSGGGPTDSETGRAAIRRLRSDLDDFRVRCQLSRVVVINLASTEPPPGMEFEAMSLADVDRRLEAEPAAAFRPSFLYAYAAIESHAAFVNFTASKAASVRSIAELAVRCKVPFCGNDGKTGETLVKSALAPMFRARRLQVDSWVGFNILGNRDGQVLADRENRESKVKSKDGVISGILGYSPQTIVGIEYVESIWDDKVAWDHIHFRGFLGHAMTMQFTWQGCDSILAAPLAIDLARLADHSLRLGEVGVMRHAAAFFKSPIDESEHDLHRQVQRLEEYVAKPAAGRAK